MSPDFRKSTNNTNSKQGGANSQPSSFQGAKTSSGIKKAKKSKSSFAGEKEKDESLIEKNLRKGYADYSKDEEPISRAVQEIVKDGDFSPEAIKRKADQIKFEEINKLKSKYPGVFEDGDFSSDNIEKPSSGTIDTATQRTFRDLKNEIAKEGDIISVEAINELAGLEYFSKHLEELKEKAVKTREISENKVKGGLEGEVKNNIIKQKKNKPENSNLSIKKQEKEKAEKQEKDKDREIKSEKKSEKSESAGGRATISTERKVELDSNNEEDSGEDGAESVKKAEETSENLKSVPNFDDKIKKIKKDFEANKEKEEVKKETAETSIKEQTKEAENKDGLDEIEVKEKIEGDTRDKNIKEFRKKMAVDTEESRKSYGEAMKEIEGLAKEEGFEELDIDRSGRAHISTNRYGFTKNSSDSSVWIKAEYDTPDNKRVVLGEENLKNFNEWMQTDSKESKKSIQNLFRHEAQHLKSFAKKSSDKEGKEIKKRLEEEDTKIIKGEPAKTLSQIAKEEHGRFYSGRNTQGRGYEMQTELQRINENYKNIDDFIDTQAGIKLGVDIGSNGLDYISKNPYILENVDDILPIEHYNFIKPGLKKKVVSRLEEMREDLADKYEIKKNKDNLKIFEEVLKDPESGGLDLAEKMRDNASAKIDFLTKKIDLRNELRKLVKDEAEKTGKNEEEILNSINESKEYQKNLLERKLNQVNVNIADSKFRDDLEKIKAYEDEKEKIIREYEETLPASMPLPVPPPAPIIHSRTSHISSRASAPLPISASFHIPPSPAASTPSFKSPSQGPVKLSIKNQDGKTSTKLVSSIPTSPSSSQASLASSAPAPAPAPAVPSISASKTSPVRAESVPVQDTAAHTPHQATAEPASMSAPVPMHLPASQASSAPQTITEPVSKPATTQPQVLPSRSSEKQPMNNQGEEAPVKQTSQASPAPSQAISESAQPEPQSQPEPEPVLTHTPASLSTPLQTSPAETPPPSQGLEKPTEDNASEENDGEMAKEKIEKIKDAVREKLEDSLEKNIDNGMGGVMIQGKGEKSNADKISKIKGEARDKAGQGLKESRFASLNNKMNAMNENMHRKVQEMQRIKNESLVPVKERQKEIEEKIQKQKNEIAKRFNARKRAMLEKARKLKKAAGIEAKKSHISPGMVKILTAVTLVLAVLVDLIDVVGEVGIETIVFTIIAYLINFISSIIITATWMIIFSGHRGRNNKAVKVTIRSLVFLFGLENIPIIELLPFNAIAVILNYLDYKEGNKPDKS